LGHGYAAKFAEEMCKLDEEQEWESGEKLSHRHCEFNRSCGLLELDSSGYLA
jgi:hypothetical protein